MVGFGSDTEDTVKLIRIEKQNKSKIQKWQYFFLKRIKSKGRLFHKSIFTEEGIKSETSL